MTYIPQLARRILKDALRRTGLMRRRQCPLRKADRLLTADHVSQIISHQFPQLGSPGIMLCGEGREHQAYEVDGQWIFRFPKRRDVLQPFMVELAILPSLRSHLPVPIPEYTFTGAPCEHFPYVFAGYQKILGVGANRVTPNNTSLPEIAKGLGLFLSRLHSFPTALALEAGVPPTGWHSSAASYRHMAQRKLHAACRVLPKAVARQCARILDDPQAVPPGFRSRTVLVHQDLTLKHILLDPHNHSLAGIIDWTGLAITDPSVDFLYLWVWRGDEFVRDVLAHYTCEIDAAFPSRVRYLGICLAIAQIADAIEADDEQKLASSSGALTRTFA